MVGKKCTSLSKCLGFILLSIIIVSLSGCSSTKSEEKISIGISQITEHPALDSSRDGFLDALKEKGYDDGKNMDIDIQLAQGDMALTKTISDNFISQEKDLILAISTQSAQSALQSTSEIPILFTAITDPVLARLVKDMEAPDGNITGTTDMAPIDKQLELGKRLFPNTKKVGVIYNTSEVNSQVQVDKAKEISKNMKIDIVDIPVTNSSEIESALNAKIKEIDFLFLPSDNLIASSMPIISKIAVKNKVGTIGVDEPMVKNGALACEGVDYYKLGYETGLMAVDILDGKDIKDIPVSTLKETQLTINERTAKELGLDIPEELLNKGNIIKEDE